MAAANLITTFPFYARDEDCTHNRHWCKNKSLFIQPAPLTRLPSWIIKNPGTGTLNIWANNRSTGNWLKITSLITTASVTVGSDTFLIYNWASFSAVTTAGYYDAIDGTHLGNITWTEFTQDCAQIQLVVIVGTTYWYSELLYIKDDLPADHVGVTPDDPTGCILLDFTDDTRVGDIPYSDITFSQRCFLPCDLGRPTYEIVLDGPEDGDRIQNPSYRRAIKRWSTTLLLPEYMTDALALMAIHSTMTVADQYDVQSAMYEVAVEPDWSFGPNLANTTLTFRRDFVRKYNC